MNRGVFITLEGPDGSGKSTVAKLLKEHLESLGMNCILTREPGGTKIGEKVRNVILDNNNSEMGPETEALLYAAARAQHVSELIEPMLSKGYVVISDRYVLSSLAYQGHARDLGIKEVMEINEFAMNGLKPDRVIFFDISPEKALARKFINREGDRLENAGEEFHKLTYEGYKKAIEKYDEDVKIIDASGTIKENLASCISQIEDLIDNSNY